MAKFTSPAGTSWTSPCLSSETMSWWCAAATRGAMVQWGRSGFRVGVSESLLWSAQSLSYAYAVSSCSGKASMTAPSLGMVSTLLLALCTVGLGIWAREKLQPAVNNQTLREWDVEQLQAPVLFTDTVCTGSRAFLDPTSCNRRQHTLTKSFFSLITDFVKSTSKWKTAMWTNCTGLEHEMLLASWVLPWIWNILEVQIYSVISWGQYRCFVFCFHFSDHHSEVDFNPFEESLHDVHYTSLNNSNF